MYSNIFIVIILGICLFCIIKYRNKFLFFRKLAGDSEKIGERIIRTIPDMVFIFDRSLRLLKIYNPNEKELMVPVGQLIGKNIHDTLAPKFVEIIGYGIEKSVESDRPYEVEYEAETPDGTQYYEGRFLHVRDNEIACFVRNITERKKNELLLKQNQELLNSVLDSIPFPVMLKDANDKFRYIYWNKECEKQGGFRKDEILGKTDVDIYGEERGGYYQSVAEDIVKEGKSYRNQEIFATPDGKEHVSIVYKNLIYSDVHRWLLVTRWDITDLALAEQSLKEANRINRLILDNTNIGFVFLSPDYVVQWENISTIFGGLVPQCYQTGTVCYKTVRGLDHPCQECVMQEAVAAGCTQQKVVCLNDKRIFESVATPVYNEDKKLQGVVLRMEDVTIKKQISEELQKAKENAEKSDRLKSAFLANMSHEIRTPLNAILGFSELLCNAEDEQEKQVYMEIIKNNNDLLLQLINDILDLSKIEANTLEFIYSNVDVNVILRELERSFQFKISDNPDLQILFVPGLDICVIHTEKNRFLQVISNFITNAIKFTEKGTITFGYVPCENGLRFYVSDTGTGIPQSKQQEIFDRFVKLDSFKNGTGLGLSICQTIVRKLNGEIGVESEEGKGSEFWFTIPCEISENVIGTDSVPMLMIGEELPEKNERSGSGKPLLLIAEDILDNYRLYQAFLEKHYDLLHAWNGREAVELFRKHQPDAVLMDIKMPEMNGFEAVALIRKTDTAVPVIAVTAFAFAEDRERIMSSGFSACITKPVTAASLSDVLDEVGRK